MLENNWLIVVCTNAVVAICVVLVLTDALGAVGVPVSAGLASGAFKFNAEVTLLFNALIAVPTNAVVAICVVLVLTDALGAVGTPVSAGLANGA